MATLAELYAGAKYKGNTRARTMGGASGVAVANSVERRRKLLEAGVKSGKISVSSMGPSDKALMDKPDISIPNQNGGKSILGMLGNLGTDIWDTGKYALPGLASVAKNFGSATLGHVTFGKYGNRDAFGEMTDAAIQNYKNVYGPGGGSFWQNFYEHPLGPILDAATVVSGGASLAAKGGRTAVARGGSPTQGIGRLASLTSREGRSPLTSPSRPDASPIAREYTPRPLSKFGQMGIDRASNLLGEGYQDWRYGRGVKRDLRRTKAMSDADKYSSEARLLQDDMSAFRDLTPNESFALMLATAGIQRADAVEFLQSIIKNNTLADATKMKELENLGVSPAYINYIANAGDEVKGLVENPSDTMVMAHNQWLKDSGLAQEALGFGGDRLAEAQGRAYRALDTLAKESGDFPPVAYHGTAHASTWWDKEDFQRGGITSRANPPFHAGSRIEAALQRRHLFDEWGDRIPRESWPPNTDIFELYLKGGGRPRWDRQSTGDVWPDDISLHGQSNPGDASTYSPQPSVPVPPYHPNSPEFGKNPANPLSADDADELFSAFHHGGMDAVDTAYESMLRNIAPTSHPMAQRQLDDLKRVMTDPESHGIEYTNTGEDRFSPSYVGKDRHQFSTDVFAPRDGYPIQTAYAPMRRAEGFVPFRQGLMGKLFPKRAFGKEPLFRHEKHGVGTSPDVIKADTLFYEPKQPFEYGSTGETLMSGIFRTDPRVWVEQAAAWRAHLRDQVFHRDTLQKWAAKGEDGEMARFANDEEARRALGPGWKVVNDKYPIAWFAHEENLLKELQAALETAGKNIDDIPTNWQAMIDQLLESDADAFVKAHFGAMKRKGVAIPRELYDEQVAYAKLEMPYEHASARWLARQMYRWRTLTLTYMLRWTVNTAVGSFLMSVTRGVTPRDLAIARQMQKAKIFDNIPGVNLGHQPMTEMMDMGTAAFGRSAADIYFRTLFGKSMPTRFIMEKVQGIEDYFRRGQFVHNLRREGALQRASSQHSPGHDLEIPDSDTLDDVSFTPEENAQIVQERRQQLLDEMSVLDNHAHNLRSQLDDPHGEMDPDTHAELSSELDSVMAEIRKKEIEDWNLNKSIEQPPIKREKVDEMEAEIAKMLKLEGTIKERINHYAGSNDTIHMDQYQKALDRIQAKRIPLETELSISFLKDNGGIEVYSKAWADDVLDNPDDYDISGPELQHLKEEYDRKFPGSRPDPDAAADALEAMGDTMNDHFQEAVGQWGGDLEKALNDPEVLQRTIDETNKFAYNYSILGPRERRYVRQFAPFWGWYKFISMVAWRLPVEMPGRANFLYNLAIIGKEEEDSIGLVPDWVKGSLIFSQKDGNIRFMSALGLNPLGQFFNPLSPKGMVEGAFSLGQMNPALQALLSAYGLDPMTGEQVRISPESGVSTDFNGTLIDPNTGEDVRPSAVGAPQRLVMGLFRSVPQARLFEKYVVNGGGSVYPESIPYIDPKPMAPAAEGAPTGAEAALGAWTGLLPKSYDVGSYQQWINKRKVYGKAKQRNQILKMQRKFDEAGAR